MSIVSHDVPFVGIAFGLTLALLFPAPSAAQVKPTLRSVPQVDGFWEGPYDWPHTSTHTAVLTGGNVLGYSAGPNAQGIVWTEFDPVHYQVAGGFLAKNLFDAGHVVGPDGRLMIAGGTSFDPSTGALLGPTHTEFFDPWTHTWSPGDDMEHGRINGTLVSLADGSVLALAGIDEHGAFGATVERFDPTLGWHELVGADLPLPTFPRAHLLSFGGVFVAGPDPVSWLLDPYTPTWYPVAQMSAAYRAAGCSVLVPGFQDRVLAIGGSADGTFGSATCETIDLAQSSVAWQPADALERARMFHHALLLPDGTVLVVGGAEFDDPAAAVHAAEVYHPKQDHWRTLAASKRGHAHHSSAALLPDGRVLVAGGDDQSSIEIFWPPYMFRPRPAIEHVASDWHFGAASTLDLADVDASDIERVALLRPVTSTHSIAFDQRYVDLSFGVSGDRQLVVDAPANPNVAPLGVYLLVVVDSKGTPSVAQFVYLS